MVIIEGFYHQPLLYSGVIGLPSFRVCCLFAVIYDRIVQDSRRKFIWEEMSYLERWWRDASDTKRESFINLVKNGQLEIVGGGWVMNDEVSS